MATSNEQLRDSLIAHQIDLLRYSAGLGRRLTRLLDRAEPDLRAQLRRRLETAARIGFDPGPATTRRLQAIEQMIRNVQAPVWRDFNALARSELIDLANQEIAFTTAAVASSLPVVVQLAPPEREQIRRMVTGTPAIGNVLGDWLRRIQVNDRRRIMEQVRIGLLFDETPLQVSRRIFGTQSARGRDGVRQRTRNGAFALANTLMSMTTNQARSLLHERNKKLMQGELYVATLDSRTTPICRSLDGNVYEVGDGPHPPVHFNCRSLRVPYLAGQQLGTRPAITATERQLAGLSRAERRRAVRRMVGNVPRETTYQQWLTRQTAAFQDEVLGRTRARLFRRGDLELDRFVDFRGRQYTLDELRRREPRAFQAADL